LPVQLVTDVAGQVAGTGSDGTDAAGLAKLESAAFNTDVQSLSTADSSQEQLLSAISASTSQGIPVLTGIAFQDPSTGQEEGHAIVVNGFSADSSGTDCAVITNPWGIQEEIPVDKFMTMLQVANVQDQFTPQSSSGLSISSGWPISV